MRKIGVIAVLAMLVLAIAAVPALAVTNFDNAPSGAHYRQGFGEPECEINEETDTVTCTETQIGGVGNTNAVVELTVTADAFLTCTNRGGNLVEPHSTTVSDSTEAIERPNRNGQIVLDAIEEDVTEDEVTGEFTCPNRNWREDVQDIDITGFTYTVTFVGFTEPAIVVTG